MTELGILKAAALRVKDVWFAQETGVNNRLCAERPCVMLARRLPSDESCFLPASGVTVAPCRSQGRNETIEWDLWNKHGLIQSCVFHSNKSFPGYVLSDERAATRCSPEDKSVGCSEQASRGQMASVVTLQTWSDHEMFHFGISKSSAAFDPAVGSRVVAQIDAAKLWCHYISWEKLDFFVPHALCEVTRVDMIADTSCYIVFLGLYCDGSQSMFTIIVLLINMIICNRVD